MPGYTRVGAKYANDAGLRTVAILADRRRAAALTESDVWGILFGGRPAPGLDCEVVAALRRIAEHLVRCGT